MKEKKPKDHGRSIPGFDLYDTLAKSKEYLDKFGGHEMAVGLSIKRKNLENFKKKVQTIAKESKLEDLNPIIKIDAEMTLENMNKEMIQQLSLLEPFGESNRVPLFIYKNLKIDSIRALSEGKHLKLTLKDNNNIIDAIGFNMGQLSSEYLIGDKVDVVGVFEINSFNGAETIQINLRDIMKSY